MFPAYLTYERVFLIELRGCIGTEFRNAVSAMRPRLTRASNGLGITFQINGDKDSALIRSM